MKLHSQACVDLVSSFEGLRLSAYQDGNGILTIGYGHTSGVKEGDVCLEAQAKLWLSEDLTVADIGVNRALTVEVEQHQYDAMVSLCFNIGSGAFLHSTVAREMNAGNLGKAADAFLLWCKVAGAVSKGLLKRRQAERSMFLGYGT